MKTISVSAAEMGERIARYDALRPLAAQTDPEIPQEAADIVWSRELLSVIGPGSARGTPINAGAPIQGAGGMTMTLARCPPGQGPSLHAHRDTYETFTVLQGRFELRWNDDGGERVALERFDTISIPPRVCRGFRNVGDEEGILQVLITGGVHDMNDIDFPRSTAREIEAIGPGVLAAFERTGLTFTAGAA